MVTLGVESLAAAGRLYGEGFGWTPVFENAEIVFYQMNGLVLGTFLRGSLDEDMGRRNGTRAGAYALAHNLGSEVEVDAAVERLLRCGGSLLRAPDHPPHGGYRGYVADPDGHAWEIAWNPAWMIDVEGRVTFGV